MSSSQQAELVSVTKIWDQAPHNAITDLVRFKGRWICTFRESDMHVYGINGRIRVLESDDGDSWRSAALLADEGFDLREGELSITPDGRLMKVGCGSVYQGETLKSFQSRVFFSDDGRTWTTLWTAQQAEGERSYVPLAGGASRFLRLDLRESGAGDGFGIVDVDVRPDEFSRSPDAFFHSVAQAERRGLHPRWLVREQSYWTPIGVASGSPSASRISRRPPASSMISVWCRSMPTRRTPIIGSTKAPTSSCVLSTIPPCRSRSTRVLASRR